MNPKTFTRRQLVRGAGGIVVGLPFLETLAPRTARAAAPPRRFVVFNWPEGMPKDQATRYDFSLDWLPPPGAGRTDFALAPLMEPLAPFRNKLILTRGIDNASAGPAPQDHKVSMAHILTGGSGTSIDQVIAKAIGPGHRFASLEFGVRVSSMSDGGRVVYAGGKPIPCLNEPRQMFQRMFTGGVALPATGAPTLDEGAILKLAARRKSVIDAVKAQFDALRLEVGAADRQRLEAHLAMIRQAEKELLDIGPAAQAPSPAVDCKAPALPEATTSLPVRTRQQLDLLVLALACRLTPVATLQWSQTGCMETFPWLGSVPNNLHSWVHNDSRSAAYTEQWRRILRWFAEQMAYLLDRMSRIDEGGQSLLDASAVVMVSSYGVAGWHNPANAPFVIAGGAGGALRTGQFLDYSKSRQPANRLFLSLARAYGITMPSFGDPRYGTTPLAEILA